MGQQVGVIERASTQPGTVRFETNRSLTGMGHERFISVHEATGTRPAAVIARMLLTTGKVDSVHVYGNMVTVELARGYTSEGLSDVVRDLYQYWKPGMEPQVFEAPAPEAAAEAPAAAAGGAGGGDSEYLRLVPAILVERSRAAMAKWKATHG
jgi:hypothetical protein